MAVKYYSILTLEIIGFSYHGNLPWKITAIVLQHWSQAAALGSGYVLQLLFNEKSLNVRESTINRALDGNIYPG